ncbi:MAG: GDSL-type esterase/lipase family protein [Frankiaceae bacterium]
MTYETFVALGDSFTEGLDDPAPAGHGYVGWADRVAGALASVTPGLRYANLAVRGRLLGPIVADQVPAAIHLRPRLVSLAGGTNDILRPRCDPPALAALLDDAVRRLRDTGAEVLVFTATDPTRRLPSARRLLPRIQVLNDAVRRVAGDHGALLVDLWQERVFDDPRLWSDDRLHLGPEGHRRVAAAVLERLGVAGVPAADGDWRALPPAAGPPQWLRARLADAGWARRHLAPWVYRRLTGRSSGDELAAKQAELAPLLAPGPHQVPDR